MRRLLDCARAYFADLGISGKVSFCFLHISTYAASKAAADHLVRAWHHTYGLPVLTTNCSNNYGPYQFPEKLISLMILKPFEGGGY